ncbi:MAG TPA: ABC transporter permease, partial [Bacillota bacterium]|nr:ABC transporter permease [Bacillota bacterium]
MRIKKKSAVFEYAASVALLLLLWEVVSILLNEPFFPGPVESFRVFARELGKDLGWHLIVSTARVVVSLIAALVPAVILGMYLGSNERFDRYAAPMIYLVYPVPKIIFLPVIIIFLGIGNMSKVFL